MDIYKIADLNIGVCGHSPFSKEYMKDYLTTDTTYDFKVDITADIIEYEKQISTDGVPEQYYEITAILREICKHLIDYNAFFLHCSCLEYEGNAYVFTAKSGTGKSTHSRLWREVFADKVTIINDDKPIVRLVNNVFYIYGTPWNGKHSLSCNTKAPIKAIYYLNQAKDNKCTKCDDVGAISKLLSQTVLPDNKDSMNSLLNMLEKLIGEVIVFDLECNISNDAVYTALNSVKE